MDGFEWLKTLCKFDECVIKNSNENSGKGHFLELDVEYPKNLFSLRSNLLFLPARKKIEKCNKLILTLMIRKTMLFI